LLIPYFFIVFGIYLKVGNFILEQRQNVNHDLISSLQHNHGVGARINRSCCEEKDIWHMVRFFYEISKSCGGT